MLTVRIFFVGLISFTPTGSDPGDDWLALLLDARDRYGVANHAPKLHYCKYQRHAKDRCLEIEPLDIPKQRINFGFKPKRKEHFEPYTDSKPCDPDRMQAPPHAMCGRDYRWITGARRTLNRQAGRKWCCRDWFVLPPCNTVSFVVLDHGRLENCRFVEGGPPTLPERAIYGLSGLRQDGKARVASEISMVKIEEENWDDTQRFIVDFKGLPFYRCGLKSLPIRATPCGRGEWCIDILIDNRPPPLTGLTHRPLVASHFDLYRSVMGNHPRDEEKAIPHLNEGFRVPLNRHPCKADESPLLSSDLLLAAGNERPICPEIITE